MSELSERSGVPIASVKFYLRERLLPSGTKTSANQTNYSDAHVDRLRVVRALIEVGGLSVSSARAVLSAVDTEDMPLDWAFGVAQRAASKSIPAAEVPAGASALAEVDRLVDERGWNVTEGNPGRAIAARVIETYRLIGQDVLVDSLPAYADAAVIIAEADLAAVARRPDRASMVETVVVGESLGDTLLAGLRRIAQEHISRSLFPVPPSALVDPTECEDELP
jgi:DNA-binding transcriptional MerR regulator